MQFIRCIIYLELLFDSITAPAIEKPDLVATSILVTSQMFANGGGIKGCDHVPALVTGAQGPIQCHGVDHVVVVGGELVPVLHHHVLHHLLDGVAVGEAGRVHLQASLALECLVSVTLLDVSDGLSLDNVFTTIVTSLGWTTDHLVRSVEPFMILLEMQEPLSPGCVTKGGITAPARQLQLAHHLTLVCHAVNTLKMCLNVLHVLLKVTANPESLSAKKIWW